MYLVFLFLLAAILPFREVSAQRRISSVSIGSGEGAIASGIVGVVRTTNKDSSEYGEFAVMAEQAWFAQGKQFHGRASGFIAWSAGHFQGAPWIGPYAVIGTSVATLNRRQLRLSSMQWPVYYPLNEPRSFAQDGIKNPEKWKIGYLGDVGLEYGPVNVRMAGLNFLDQPWNALPSIAVALPLTGSIGFDVSYTRNMNDRRDMWYMGLTWRAK